MKIAEDCAKLKTNVTRPKPQKVEELKKSFQSNITKDEKTLETLKNSGRRDPKAVNLRSQLIAHYKKMLFIIEKIQN